jgi:hypothetical protein
MCGESFAPAPPIAPRLSLLCEQSNIFDQIEYVMSPVP